MHQKDMERFAFLFLCGKRDREILLGKEKMTFSDLDRLTANSARTVRSF